MDPNDTPTAENPPAHFRENAATPENGGAWSWTPPRERAAEMVALDAQADEEIAREVGVNRTTLKRWKRVGEFRARVLEIRGRLRAEAEEQRQRVREAGYATIEERVRRKSERLRQIEEVRRARAEVARLDPEWLSQGGSTGLVLRQEKILGRGESARFVVEYPLDTDLIKTEIALDDAIARELGQHVQRQEVTGGADEDRTIRVVFCDSPPAGRSETTPDA
jgi:hypothetical protein